MGLNTTLADSTYSRIKDEIYRGKLAPGTRVSEIKLAKEYGVSRTPIREAVRRLSEQGLVKLQPCSHMEVTLPTARQKQQVMELHACLNTFALDHVAPEELIKSGSTLNIAAESAEAALLEGNITGMLEHTGAFCRRVFQLSGHEPLLYTYRRSVEPLLLLILSTYHCKDERLLGYAGKQKHYSLLLSEGRIEDAKSMIMECTETITPLF